MKMEQIKVYPDDEQAEMESPEIESGSHLLPGLVFTLLVFGLLGFGAVKIMDPATLPVRHVSVSGDFVNLSPFSLEQRVGDVVRGGFFNVNVETIQRTLLDEPWVRQVSVKRIWPDRITVTIREQTAVAKWGEDGLLNPDAEIFYPEQATFPDGLPLLSGPQNTNHLVMESFLDIQTILPEGLLLEELTLSERRSWELKLQNGPVIRLGKTGIINRIERFIDFFPVHDLSTTEKIRYIDMRYTNGFAIRWNPDIKPDKQVGQESYGKKI